MPRRYVCCPIAPLATVHNIVFWRKTGKGDSKARKSLYASSARGACPAAVSRARCPRNDTMCAGRSTMAASFFFRGRRKASTSTPVIVPWRAVIALMMSREDRWRVSVSGSEIARRFGSPMLSRIAAQKAAETANQADLAAVARLKASRTAGPSPAARSAGARKSGLARNAPPGGC
jgi:hypothetical protein